MNPEMLDTFDENYQKLGVASHKDVHAAGYWHRTVHCWLVHKPSGSILYQRRAAHKRLYPNLLDVSVAGHCRAGETLAEALERESGEELGLAIRADSLTPIGIRKSDYTDGKRINREFQHVFLGFLPAEIEELEFKDKEVGGLLLLKPDQVIAILRHGRSLTSRVWDGHHWQSIAITHRDFVPSTDDYDLKIAGLVQRWLLGEQGLQI